MNSNKISHLYPFYKIVPHHHCPFLELFTSIIYKYCYLQVPQPSKTFPLLATSSPQDLLDFLSLFKSGALAYHAGIASDLCRPRTDMHF